MKRTARHLLWFYVALGAIVVLVVVRPDSTGALPNDLERTTLVTGLQEPTAFRFLDSGEVMIAEKGGQILLYHDGHLHPTPVLTLAVDNEAERGLLGIEPAPDFATTGHLYVSYTTVANHDRLSRFTVSGGIADPGSEVVLLESDQLGREYHHGGDVRFGSDGKLYWATGMNGQSPNSQNLGNIHGKILRLKPDGSAPADNPYVNTPGAIPQIWATGLRNPFRLDVLPDGRLIAGDVGGDLYEEINVIERGGNYGWPAAEGACSNCDSLNPLFAYPHTDPPEKAGSITALLAYEGDALGADYDGALFYADYTLGFIRYLEVDGTVSSVISDNPFDEQAGTPVQLSQAPDGSIWQLDIFPGALSRIAPSGGDRSPTAVAEATPTDGLAPLEVTFSSGGSFDPDPGSTLSYLWDFGDGTTSSNPNPVHTYSENGTFDATLTVTSGAKSAVDHVTVTVGNRRPVVTIDAPTDLSHYDAGDTIDYSASATDPEDGALADAAFSWKVIFHHADHIHPFLGPIAGSATGSFVVPTSSDNVSTTWYEIQVTVTDAGGLSSTTSVGVHPNLATVTWTSNEPTATITVDGRPYTGTVVEQAVVGVAHTVGAASPQHTSAGSFRFSSWSDGGAQSHTVVVPPGGATFTANFDAYTEAPPGWSSQDIGSPATQGGSSYSGGVLTVDGGGTDIWGDADQSRFVSIDLPEDGDVIARVTGLTASDEWAKAGVMVKQSTDAGSSYAVLAVTPDHGVVFQRDFSRETAAGPYVLGETWLQLQRRGSMVTALLSTDGVNWAVIGTDDIGLTGTVRAGVFTTSHRYNETATAVFDQVSVTPTLPSGWVSGDVGSPVVGGSASFESGSGRFTVSGAGNDIWADQDQFRYVWRPLAGDGSIVARVSSVVGATNEWSKVGVMVKQSASAGSPYGLLAVTSGNGVVLQSGFNSSVAGGSYVLPDGWLRLDRVGSTVSASVSGDGLVWTSVGSVSVPEGAATVGLFVTSHDGGALATATFHNVTVTGAG